MYCDTLDSRDTVPLQRMLAIHLVQRAAEYYRHCVGQTGVTLLKASIRPVSTLYAFRLDCPAATEQVLVKVYHAPQNAEAVSNVANTGRPWLFPKPAWETKAELEYCTLTHIHQYFTALADPRMTAIRILDCLPELRAVVMEKVPATSLDTHLLGVNRLRPFVPVGGSQAAFRHAGAWLRRFHALPPLEHTQARHTSRDEFIGTVAEFTSYLSQKQGNAPYFKRICETTNKLAYRCLPERLPLGLSHTDFAPRNVLVGRDDRVAVCDTLGRWRAPIYEDIAHFLVALETAEPQMISQGWLYNRRALDECGRQFLGGYFPDTEVPEDAIRVFQIQQLLYKWVIGLHSRRQAKGWRQVAKGCRQVLRTRFLARGLSRMLPEAEL